MRMNLCYALMAMLGLAPVMGVNAQYDLTIEQSTPAAAPGTVYRFYVEANDGSQYPDNLAIACYKAPNFHLASNLATLSCKATRKGHR